MAQPWKRPDLADQPALLKLNDELHSLRLDAGLPSARTIRDGVGRDHLGWIVNHQAVLDAFQKAELPPLGRLELIVAALAVGARLRDVDGEVDRFKDLWKKAVMEAVDQASLHPPEYDSDPDSDDETTGAEDATTEVPRGDGEPRVSQSPADHGAPGEGHGADGQSGYAEESLKGLIINTAQALWHDKDALRVFLAVVRRSAGFSRMADALVDHRPANATFYGVGSREFEVAYSPAGHELSALHRALDEHRRKRGWTFTAVEEETRISADAWIRWSVHRELPPHDALVAFSHMAHLNSGEHFLLLALWEAARTALDLLKQFDALPPRTSFDGTWAMCDGVAPRLWALVGVGGPDLEAFGPDLGSGAAPAFVVAGPPGAGRSTALMTIARSLLASGNRLVLSASKPSPIRGLAGREGVMVCFDQEDLPSDELEAALMSAATDRPIVVVIDDAHLLAKRTADRVLRNLLRHGLGAGTALVVGVDEDQRSRPSWLHDATKAHRGLLLSPQAPSAGDLVGLRISQGITGRRTPGRGWLHLGDGVLRPVTVPQ